MPKQTNTNRRDPLPGFKSPLFSGSFACCISQLLIFMHGKNDTDLDRAVYAFMIAATALMTNDSAVRCTSILGGAIRFFGTGPITEGVGFLTQMVAFGCAAKRSLGVAREVIGELLESSNGIRPR